MAAACENFSPTGTAAALSEDVFRFYTLKFRWKTAACPTRLPRTMQGASMDYVKLGRTGTDVSRICLGCMSYGVPARGSHPWVLDNEQARPFIKKALDLGINFFDTANVYSDGTSEEIVGGALHDFARRDEVVLATKVFNRMHPGPNGGGLSRKAIMAEVDASLRRLRTDYIDLYQIHRWDYSTPIEETLEALHDVVKAGKARYIGASSMHTWQFAKARQISERNGWTRFVSMQNHVNLLYREEEREMLPFCASEGVAVIPWSPLARGRLTRAWDEGSARSETDNFGKTLYARFADTDRQIVAHVGEIAAARGVPRAQVALAWLLQKAPITAPIVGATKMQHLEDAVAALALKLTPEEIAKLEEAYVPHAVAGFN
jgi:aryl-alcohol dehydrogenase-like predicted oxidoreductase